MATEKKRTFTHAHRQSLERAAAQYLQQCYKLKTRASVAEFAAILKRNPDYMSRTAASIAGISLLELLRAEQMKEAERLLTIGESLTIEEIALHAGFGTPSTLYRHFKAAHNMPPGRFRKVRKRERK